MFSFNCAAFMGQSVQAWGNSGPQPNPLNAVDNSLGPGVSIGPSVPGPALPGTVLPVITEGRAGHGQGKHATGTTRNGQFFF